MSKFKDEGVQRRQFEQGETEMETEVCKIDRSVNI
jgi:hypothetical protein